MNAGTDVLEQRLHRGGVAGEVEAPVHAGDAVMVMASAMWRGEDWAVLPSRLARLEISARAAGADGADYGMGLQAAFDTPRIDASEGATLIGDARLAPEVQAALAADFDFVAVSPLTLPMKFAFPSAVLRDGTINQGATEIFQPWGDAVAGG